MGINLVVTIGRLAVNREVAAKTGLTVYVYMYCFIPDYAQSVMKKAVNLCLQGKKNEGQLNLCIISGPCQRVVWNQTKQKLLTTLCPTL